MKKITKLIILLLVLSVLVPLTSHTVSATSPIKLNYSTINMSTADSVTLKVLNTSKKTTWSSSNKKVAKVNSTGKITPIWTGKTIISAKVNGKTLKCTVNILDETLWSMSDNYNYNVGIMPISKNKVRIKLYSTKNNKNYESGSLYAYYNDEGILLLSEQGKYNISGALTIDKQDGEKKCFLVIVESDIKTFLTDGLIFDIFIENS